MPRSHPRRSIGRAAAALALACLAIAPLRAEAQFGSIRDRVKKQISDKVNKSADSARATPADVVAPNAAPASSPRSGSSENTVALSADVIDRVLRGVAAEGQHESDRQATIAANPVAPNNGAGDLAPYFSCMQSWQMTPEARQLDDKRTVAHRARRNGSGSADAAANADSAYQHGIDAKCGTLQQAQAKAAASSQARENAKQDTRDVGPSAAQLTPLQFAVARERMTAFVLLAGARGDCMRRSLKYAYSDAEVSALTPRSEQLAAALATPHDTTMALGYYCRSGTTGTPTKVMHSAKKTVGGR